MLSSHCFLCLPLHLPPWTVPWRIVLASPDDHVMCLYHLTLHLFTEVRRSSYSSMAFPILAFTSSLVMWSLYEILRSCKHLISSACILSMSAVMVHVSHAYKNMDMAMECISLILELMAMFLSFQMTFSLVTAAVVWAILDSTSGLNPLSQIFEAMDGLQFLVVYGNVSADAIGVICHQLGLLCTDLHAMCCGGLFKVIYQLDQLLLLSS